MFFITSNLVQMFNVNIKFNLCRKVTNLTFFCKHSFTCLILVKIVLRKLSTLGGGVYIWIEPPFLSKNELFSETSIIIEIGEKK